MMWVMLNPSTADAEEDDPTIRRCMGFARRENCGGIIVVNLFAMRATDPARLGEVSHGVAVGSECDRLIQRHARGVEIDGGIVVYGWGANKAVTVERVEHVHGYLKHLNPVCLGVTKSGAPRHPLYVKGDAPLVPFSILGVLPG
jgi:hypothetical protein